MKNIGSAAGTITSVYIDSIPIPDSNYNASRIVPGEVHTSIPDRKNGLRIEVGKRDVMSIYVSDNNYTDGSRINMDIRLHSANGNDYVQIPYQFNFGIVFSDF